MCAVKQGVRQIILSESRYWKVTFVYYFDLAQNDNVAFYVQFSFVFFQVLPL